MSVARSRWHPDQHLAGGLGVRVPCVSLGFFGTLGNRGFLEIRAAVLAERDAGAAFLLDLGGGLRLGVLVRRLLALAYLAQWSILNRVSAENGT